MNSHAQLRQDNKKSIQFSRPSSRNNSFLPEIVQTPSQNQFQKQQMSSIFNSSKGMDQLNLFKISQVESNVDQITSRMEIQRKELIREIFRQEKKPTVLKPLIKQQESTHRSRLRKDDQIEDQQTQLKSILKRKSSNSREHADIFDFFELDNSDLKQQQQKPNFNRLKHSKQVSLQPIEKDDYSPQINPGKKIVSFNKQIQIKVIDPNEEKPKSNQKTFRRMYTVADLLDKS
ncbi:unnamed protein product [Paramecium pentaurelia]|uniref:Uncharacterized protein n=1 Tax=Paramecium pentaurelia TaxID=43138 RepID=A0A8S1SD95_9CILI|nr:unnamed protein product [Paramecium pentaurelia]